MSPMVKRIAITMGIFVVLMLGTLLFTYQIIDIKWISMMVIQPSYRPMTDPLQLPPQSVPVQGAAFVPLSGSPANPIPADKASLGRGQFLFELNCAVCHGFKGKGDGSIVDSLSRKPPDLTSEPIKNLSDGEIFLVITNGINPGIGRRGGMPALRENTLVSDRWDMINYLRSLQQP